MLIKICEHCGNVFRTRVKRQRFCAAPECRKAATVANLKHAAERVKRIEYERNVVAQQHNNTTTNEVPNE